MAKYEEQILTDENVLTRFWSKIVIPDPENLDACWRWTAKKDKDRCGIITMTIPGIETKRKQRDFRAPRLMWILENERPIPDGLYVIHSCDNEECLNPKHIRLGTQQDNMNDRKLRGRFDTGPKGESHPHAILTNKKVKEICRLKFSRGLSYAEIARKLGVSYCVIGDIIRGKNWKHVTKTLIPKNYQHMTRKLMENRKQEIYKMAKNKISKEIIAEKFDLSIAHINLIIRKVKRKNGEPVRARSKKPYVRKKAK